MKPREAKLDHSTLTRVLDYDPETGVFRWKEKISDKVVVGKAAGFCDNGYVRISIYGDQFMAHRLAWLYVYGEWPAEEVDHINMDRKDNRISNLRPVTKSENMRNRGKQVNNRSGFKGVSPLPDGRFSAQIHRHRRKKHLGIFNTAEEAHAAYLAELPTNHGEYGRGS